MFNNQSDYALNKKDSTAIVYQDANGTIIRLTEEAFSSKKEFRKWKNWTDMKCHSEEKKEHIHANHTVSLDGLDLVLPASLGIEEVRLEEENHHIWRNAQFAMLHQLHSLLTETQFRRMLLYYGEGKDTYEIAKIEGTCHQAISQSLAAAEKKIASKLKKA